MGYLTKGIGGGVCIGIGGCVFLACGNKTVGAVAFSVALCSILWLELWLYTGKCCYVFNVKELALGLIGNIIGVVILAGWVMIGIPELVSKAGALAAAKEMQTWYQAFARGVLCELLIYIAVEVRKKHGDMLGVLICVPVFILAGFEHSIADMFYFVLAGKISAYPLYVLAGNTVGGLTIIGFNIAIGRE